MKGLNICKIIFFKRKIWSTIPIVTPEKTIQLSERQFKIAVDKVCGDSLIGSVLHDHLHRHLFGVR